MSKNILLGFGIGVAGIALAVGATFFLQRGAHLELQGKILKVRTAPLDENTSVAVIDFRLTNPTAYPFMADTVVVSIEDSGGKRINSETIPDVDATRVIEGIPSLGAKYNNTLATRDKVGPHSTVDRMVSASFEMPEAKLLERKRLIVRIPEIDGNLVVEFDTSNQGK